MKASNVKTSLLISEENWTFQNYLQQELSKSEELIEKLHETTKDQWFYMNFEKGKYGDHDTSSHNWLKRHHFVSKEDEREATL